MTLPAALCLATSLVALYLAITSLRLSRAHGWHAERWTAAISLSAVVYIAVDIPTTLGVSDALINGLNGVQAVAAGTNLAAWLIYSRIAVGRAPSRRVSWFAAILVALAALAVIPGVGFSGRVLLIECPLFGVTYRLAEATSIGSVLYGAYTLTFVGIAVHFALAWRRGVPGMAAYCIAIGIVVVAAVNDLLVLTGLLHTPALLDIVYVVPVGAAVLSLTGRVVRDAAVLGDLSAGLERQVEQRTKELRAALDEVKRAQGQMVQCEKMAAIGQLAAGVAHEINNPLGVILGFAQGMERRVPGEDPLRLPVTSIVREALRCKTLVQELLTFSRTGKKTTEEVGLGAVVRSSLVLLAAQAKRQNVCIVEELSDDRLLVRANKTQLQQVVVNLGTNAFDAMKDGGTLTLRTRVDGQAQVVLEVGDTGTGIAPDIQKRIFEPFFTTKDPGQGTGLGLSLVYEIVRQHEGSIEVHSEPGKGTVMSVRLPAAPVAGRPQP